jgi:hypothetical protein
MVWGKETLTMNQIWVKQAKGTYDFDVTNVDKVFEFLVKEGRIKLPEGDLFFGQMDLKRKDITGFTTEILTPSMSAEFSG